MIQLQGDPGNVALESVFQTTVTVSGIGDITIDVIGQITDYASVKVNIIGATTMTVPYSKLVNQADWVTDTQISSTGDVIFTSDISFSGKIVISGK
ncbi:hypothetical protein [Salmonella phage SD-1_S14]|nr:hypothetical protein [Salmonella phage SD-1_S14]